MFIFLFLSLKIIVHRLNVNVDTAFKFVNLLTEKQSAFFLVFFCFAYEAEIDSAPFLLMFCHW